METAGVEELAVFTVFSQSFPSVFLLSFFYIFTVIAFPINSTFGANDR